MIGGGGGTTTSNVPADVFVSSVTIVIPAGQTTGSVTIMGDGDTVASDESIDVTAFEISGGAYSQVPQEVTATQTASAPNGASISGTVEENTTGNPGMAGVTVFIDANQNGIFDPTSDPFTTTTGSGAYVFDGLQITTPKTDTVDEILPFGFTAVTPASGSLQVPLTTNLQVTGQNFINAPPPVQTTIQLSATNLNGQSLANPTFNENNGQIIVVATLPSVATNNVVINLVFSGSAVEGLDYVASSLSIVVLAGQSSGSIVLTGLPRGVDQTSNPNIVISIASVINGSVSNSTVTATILEQSDVLTGVISGNAFQDNNFNGVQDSGEPFLANAIVYIWNAATTSFNPNVDYFTFTSAAGTFAFDGLTPGTYNVYQQAPANMVQTGPLANGTTIKQNPSGSYYFNVNTATPQASAITFGDATLTNPNLSMSLSSPTIASNGGSSTLTVQLSQTTPITVTAVIKVSGLAPYVDYTLVGPGITSPLSLSNSTFTVTFLEGQTTATYTLTAVGDTTNTLESITFDVVSVTNASTNGTAEVEAGITDASGGTRPSSSTTRRRFPVRSPRVSRSTALRFTNRPAINRTPSRKRT